MDMPFAWRAAEHDRLLVCFSHLRWDFVHQRPQHLLTRAASDWQVIYVEEPKFEAGATPHLHSRIEPSGVQVSIPILPDAEGQCQALETLITRLLDSISHRTRLGWYYTPMALEFTESIAWDACVYDCMDELTAFRNPPPGLAQNEERLLARVDVVFTGGMSLYEAKRDRHPSVYAFPSSVDSAHFGAARALRPDPQDQRAIPHPRIGYFGVIDERMDLGLVAEAAREVPDVQFVMLGPIVKIDAATIPRARNLHWLGGKAYSILPDYLSNWAAGWMPFALDETTRFISPTKTPEFLAAGLPLTSTAVPDVVRSYASAGLVRIADRATIVGALRASLSMPDPLWCARVDRCLAGQSWDQTWAAMSVHLRQVMSAASTDLLQQKGA